AASRGPSGVRTTFIESSRGVQVYQSRSEPPPSVESPSAGTHAGGSREASVPQVVGNVGHDDVFPEEQLSLDQQRGLVVEELLPPAPGNDSRHPVRPR